MKRLTIILALAVVQSTAFGASITTSFISPFTFKTPLDKLNLRIHQQFIQINRDIQAGKLTASQAKSLKAQVEAIRKEELADVKVSDSKTLTDDQLTKLNGELDTLSKQIPIP